MIPEMIGLKTERPMVLSMTGSVGTHGKNARDDVRLVQTLLNNVPPSQGGPATPLVVDGVCGPLTIGAINKFQKFKLNGFSDGRVDAPGSTIRHLVGSTIESGKWDSSLPGLVPATPNEVSGVKSMFEFPSYTISHRINSQTIPILGQSAAGSRIMIGASSTGWGAPFTPSGWTINNSVTSFDITIKDNGIYLAKMEIFQDTNTSVRQKLTIVAGIKNAGSVGPPFGLDFSLPSFDSTKGTVRRGLTGIGPFSAFSFVGVCNIGYVGANSLGGGFSLNLFQFQWAPQPPGMCAGFAWMAGKQLGIPGLAAGGGIGFCKFLSKDDEIY